MKSRQSTPAKAGDDDHPGYSDRQISEAMAARVINAIAANPKIWKQCAIIITYDESDGFYDHVPPRILSYGPDGLPLSRGVRVPLILISPYARTHAVSHVEGDHNAVIETINDIFGLPALASLPDEAQALAAGNSPAFNKFGPAGFEQKYLGPRDINSPITDSLLSGFDPKRLLGISPPLPASFAMIPDSVVNTLPHYGGHGCKAIGIMPEDVRQGIVPAVPTASTRCRAPTPRSTDDFEDRDRCGARRRRVPSSSWRPRCSDCLLLAFCPARSRIRRRAPSRLRHRTGEGARLRPLRQRRAAGPGQPARSLAGLEVDVCRAVAAAVLGSPDRSNIHVRNAEGLRRRAQPAGRHLLPDRLRDRRAEAGRRARARSHRLRRIPWGDGAGHLAGPPRRRSRRGGHLLHHRESGRAEP